MSLDYTLPRKSSLSSDSNKTFCMLGHSLLSSEEQLRQGVRWNLGTVLLFNGALGVEDKQVPWGGVVSAGVGVSSLCAGPWGWGGVGGLLVGGGLIHPPL